MEQLFDIDKLHKQQDRRRVRNIIFSIIGVTIGLGILGAVIGARSKSDASLAAANTSTDNPTSVSSVQGSNDSTLAPSTNADSDLQKQLAQEQAIAQQNEAAAEQFLKNAQNSQSSTNMQTPALTMPSAPVSPPQVSTTPPSSNCSVPSNLSSLQLQYTQATGALNGFETQMSTPGGMGSYEMNASGLAAYEQQQLTQLKQAQTNAYNALQAAEAQVHC